MTLQNKFGNDKATTKHNHECNQAHRTTTLAETQIEPKTEAGTKPNPEMQHATRTRMPPTKQARTAGKHAITKATTNTNQQAANGIRKKQRQQPISSRTRQ